MKTVFFFLLYTPWLLLCGLFSLISLTLLFWFKPKEEYDVKEFTTICKVLNSKKLLSDKDYGFETEIVGPSYDGATFKGYRLVVSPWISFLQKHNGLDTFTLFLVKKWMTFQKGRLNKKAPDKITFFSLLAQTSTNIARGIGKLLILLQL